LKQLHPTDPVTYLINLFRNISIDTDWSGNGYWEKRYNKKAELINLDPVHPLHLDFKRWPNNKIIFYLGKPYAYHQKVEQKERDIEPYRIAHLRYNSIGDELLGISTLEPLFKTLQRLMNIEEGIAQGIVRHGTPLHDIIVGDEAHPPTKEMLDNAADEVKGLNYMTEYVHPPWYRVQLIESFSLGKASKYVDPFVDNIVSATGIPKFMLLGKGEETNKAVAQQILRGLNMTIEPLQQSLKLMFEKEVLFPLMKYHNVDGCPYIQWNEILPEESTDPVKKLELLSKIAINNKPLLTWEEAREIAKLPSLKPGEIEELESMRNRPGIYLTSPHARLIQEGEKRSIVTARKYQNVAGRHFILISDAKAGTGNAYGVIKLLQPRPLSWDEFRAERMRHLISDKEAKAWWPQAKLLYIYDVVPVTFYRKLKKVKVPKGVQKFIKHVEFV